MSSGCLTLRAHASDAAQMDAVRSQLPAVRVTRT
jgi:hypothetical protein